MNKKSGFEKFHKGGPKKGAALKEHFRQEKKAQTRERKAFFEQQRADKAAARQSAADGNADPRSSIQRRNTNEVPGKFPKEGRAEGGKPTRAAGAKPERAGKDTRSKDVSPKNSSFKENRSKVSRGKDSYSKEPRNNDSTKAASAKDTRSSEPPARSTFPKETRGSDTRSKSNFSKENRSNETRPPATGTRRVEKGASAARPASARTTAAPREHSERSHSPERTAQGAKPVARTKVVTPAKAGPAQMPLNKYLAHGGVCGRREAAELVKSGKVQVNGVVVIEPGYKVLESDEVSFGGKKVTPTGNLVYILLNKPKDYITTTDDPQQRKTVLDLIGRATDERVYPVGRLDRNTSGVLLLTNDGELAQRLTHPSNQVRKVYAVSLDKALTKAHFEEILKGTPLEDGLATVDSLAYADPSDKKEVGIEIHSGKNRVVRRIFEHYGYDVKGLDRVIFAGLTKKNVPRGKWRFLAEKEVRDLKFFKKGKK